MYLLQDYQCIWCQRKVHTDCKQDSPNSCDLGRFKNMVVPPESVVVRTGRTIRKNVISSLVLPSNVESSPLIVVGNQKSGNSDCANILAAFRRQLNPSQVSFLVVKFFYYLLIQSRTVLPGREIMNLNHLCGL